MQDAKPAPSPLRGADKPRFNKAARRAEGMWHKYTAPSPRRLVLGISLTSPSPAGRAGVSSEPCFAGRAERAGLRVGFASPST